jgi:multidrug resistance efflux pump
VVAEAVVEPTRWAELRFDTAGEVAQVLVSPGDRVAAGAPLLRLDTIALELSLQRAQQDVVAQKAALDQLINGPSEAVVARAERENARQIAQAQVTLEIRQLQLDKARLDDPAAGVTAARARVEQLQLQLAQARAQDPTPDVTVAQAGLARAQMVLDDAQEEYDKSLDRSWEPEEVRDGYTRQLRLAGLDYQQAEAQIQRAEDSQKAHAIGLEILDAQVGEAQEQLAQAMATQETYTITLDILAAEVKATQLELDDLRAWENPYLDEPSEKEIAQAQARLQQAELAVTELELQLQAAELRAPFAGTVVDVRARAGDQVGLAQVVLVLAALDRLQVRTTDLTELDIVRVAVGQPAVVSVDALAGREFDGVVREIALQGQDYRGDVVYTVTVDLTDAKLDEALRWGMTAVVKIETE